MGLMMVSSVNSKKLRPNRVKSKKARVLKTDSIFIKFDAGCLDSYPTNFVDDFIDAFPCLDFSEKKVGQVDKTYWMALKIKKGGECLDDLRIKNELHANTRTRIFDDIHRDFG